MPKPKRPAVPKFKNQKSIAQATIPNSMKRIQASEPEWAQSNPAWRIQAMQLCDPYGWHIVNVDKLNEIISKLACFESMTWAEILIQARKQNHSVEVWNLEKSARDRLKELGLADTQSEDPPKVEELISLHLCGKERIWGFLDGRVLHLLWWDPDHEVCPSILKHT